MYFFITKNTDGTFDLLKNEQTKRFFIKDREEAEKQLEEIKKDRPEAEMHEVPDNFGQAISRLENFTEAITNVFEKFMNNLTEEFKKHKT